MKPDKSQFAGVLRAGQRVGPPAGGRAIMFLTLTSVAAVRNAALGVVRDVAGVSARRPWLIDLDFRNNSVFHHLEATARSDLDRPGRAFSAAFNAAPIYKPFGRRLIDTIDGVNPAKLLTLHEVLSEGYHVSRFRVEALKPGQKLALARSDAWWSAARKKTDWVIVHALPLDQGGNALVLCRDVDGVVLVVEADKTSANEVAMMRDEVIGAGGQVIGVVMANLRADARWMSTLAA